MSSLSRIKRMKRNTATFSVVLPLAATLAAASLSTAIVLARAAEAPAADPCEAARGGGAGGPGDCGGPVRDTVAAGRGQDALLGREVELRRGKPAASEEAL